MTRGGRLQHWCSGLLLAGGAAVLFIGPAWISEDMARTTLMADAKPVLGAESLAARPEAHEIERTHPLGQLSQLAANAGLAVQALSVADGSSVAGEVHMSANGAYLQVLGFVGLMRDRRAGIVMDELELARSDEPSGMVLANARLRWRPIAAGPDGVAEPRGALDAAVAAPEWSSPDRPDPFQQFTKKQPLLPPAPVEVTPTVALARPPPVDPPPFPYQAAGRISNPDGSRAVYLQRGEVLVLARQGEPLDEAYWVEQLTDTTLVVKHLPSGQTATISFPAGQEP